MTTGLLVVLGFFLLLIVLVIGAGVMFFDLGGRREEDAEWLQATITEELRRDASLSSLPVLPVVRAPLTTGRTMAVELEGECRPRPLAAPWSASSSARRASCGATSRSTIDCPSIDTPPRLCGARAEIVLASPGNHPGGETATNVGWERVEKLVSLHRPRGPPR
jgi:hypothetical protein